MAWVLITLLQVLLILPSFSTPQQTNKHAQFKPSDARGFGGGGAPSAGWRGLGTYPRSGGAPSNNRRNSPSHTNSHTPAQSHTRPVSQDHSPVHSHSSPLRQTGGQRGAYNGGQATPESSLTTFDLDLGSLLEGIEFNLVDIKFIALGYVRPALVVTLCQRATSALLREGEKRARQEVPRLIKNLTETVDRRCSQLVNEGDTLCDRVVGMAIERYDLLIPQALEEVDKQCSDIKTQLVDRTKQGVNATFQMVAESKLETAEQSYNRRIAEEKIKGERLFQEMVEEGRQKAEAEFQKRLAEGREFAEANFTATVKERQAGAEETFQQMLAEGRKKAEQIFQEKIDEERAKGEVIFQKELEKGRRTAQDMFDKAVAKGKDEGEKQCTEMIAVACKFPETDSSSKDYCDEFCFFSGACEDIAGAFQEDGGIGLRDAFGPPPLFKSGENGTFQETENTEGLRNAFKKTAFRPRPRKPKSNNDEQKDGIISQGADDRSTEIDNDEEVTVPDSSGTDTTERIFTTITDEDNTVTDDSVGIVLGGSEDDSSQENSSLSNPATNDSSTEQSFDIANFTEENSITTEDSITESTTISETSSAAAGQDNTPARKRQIAVRVPSVRRPFNQVRGKVSTIQITPETYYYRTFFK